MEPHSPIPPVSVKYFYGWISRADAEAILRGQGMPDGMFLMRENTNPLGCYRITMSYRDRIHHYNIERQADGTFQIPMGRKFPGPVELVMHHQVFKDGVVCLLEKPCERQLDMSPWAWPYVTYAALEREIVNRADALGLKGDKLVNALGPQRQHFVTMIARDYHLWQPWYHGNIDRATAVRRISESGHEDGRFLVRYKSDRAFVLSISIGGSFIHYIIDHHIGDHTGPANECYAIEMGTRFKTLMDMIGSLHNNKEGLQCRLTSACYRPDWNDIERHTQKIRTDGVNPAYGALGNTRVIEEPPNVGLDNPDIIQVGRHDSEIISGHSEVPLYGAATSTQEDVFVVDIRALHFGQQLGQGNFGKVKAGDYFRRGRKVTVAIKTLKPGKHTHMAEEELMKEARIMSQLKHKNVIRLIGVCRSETIMMVMEMASLGPLNRYLKSHMETPVAVILKLMYQVAEGMAYLESRNFVHRDLAARNVLLVDKYLAKITDFGMSKALNRDHNYYKSQEAGKWPLKWYAPECILYFTFDSKSDVWSYGITLWEALSYGAKPYRGVEPSDILPMLQQGGRLQKPELSPPEVFGIMLSCWEMDRMNRPNFIEILTKLQPFKNSPGANEA